MINKIRLKIINALIFLTGKLQLKDNEKEYTSRISLIEAFFDQILPSINEDWQGRTIIKDGTFNYFELPSGKLPKYHFVVPQIPLYVVIGDISSSSWEEARLRGISREKWEDTQLDLKSIEKNTKSLSTLGTTSTPKVLIIRWNEPINHYSLIEKIETDTNEL